ncbi:MAG TPA: hypothetical protein VMV86_01765 [Methanosarcinales archaeon]|nr:hypothetical protein [Methanosarcinales archaeon]
MPNISEIASRMHILEEKIERITPSISTTPVEDLGLSVAGIRGAVGIQLAGLTTVQRTALGVSLAALDAVKHILVYDTDDESFYTWSGTEWV